MTTVADIMTTDVATVGEQDNLLNLLNTMDVMRFRHLPVTAEGRMVGLLTERDILALSASTLLPHGDQQDEFLKKQFLVRDVMATDVLTTKPTTSAAEAGKTMLDKRIGCLPVVDEHNVLVGILTSSDFTALALKLLSA
jgi:CBS domain-containing protein